MPFNLFIVLVKCWIIKLNYISHFNLNVTQCNTLIYIEKFNKVFSQTLQFEIPIQCSCLLPSGLPLQKYIWLLSSMFIIPPLRKDDKCIMFLKQPMDSLTWLQGCLPGDVLCICNFSMYFQYVISVFHVKHQTKGTALIYWPAAIKCLKGKYLSDSSLHVQPVHLFQLSQWISRLFYFSFHASAFILHSGLPFYQHTYPLIRFMWFHLIFSFSLFESTVLSKSLTWLHHVILLYQGISVQLSLILEHI